MTKSDLKRKIASILCLMLPVISLLASCVPAADFNSRLDIIVKPYRFSMFNWEVLAISDSIAQSLNGPAVSVEDSQTVVDYFTAVADGESPAGLTDKAERIIGLQIRDILNEQSINNPFQSRLGFLKFDFPPINFTLGKPPYMLIISPRDRIESSQSVMLLQNLTEEQMATIETEAAKLKVSALVTEIGGLGATFPTFVNYKMDIRSAINAAVEEWLHQYLVFTPLGTRYVLDLLGINRNYDIVTINETVASMAAGEIGGLVYDKYYAAYEKPAPADTVDGGIVEIADTGPAFDFNAAMRNIRLNVDAMLAAGQIDEAEQYMNEQRDYIQANGYYIRKLNQAYFAFYGSYAESPTSVNPIGAEIKDIRSNAASISEFLNEVSQVTSLTALDSLK